MSSAGPEQLEAQAERLTAMAERAALTSYEQPCSRTDGRLGAPPLPFAA